MRERMPVQPSSWPAGSVDATCEFGGLLGTSAAMTTLRSEILRAARVGHPVLVTGPTGAGKELVVRALHDHGPDAAQPMFDLNCGAIPEPLIEAQLFGHERGAFTGADRRQEGILATVRGGTLFLDEIGELPLPLQARLLRVLETRRFRAVGSLVDQPFSGRIVAATHVDLRARVAARQFREDLFYRLDVLRLQVPALDERVTDIPRLAAHFVAEQPRTIRFTADAMEWLTTRRWSGNIRELKHFIFRVATFSEDDLITVCTLRGLAHHDRVEAQSLRDLARAVLLLEGGDKLEAMRRALVNEAMAQVGGNKTAAARLLGVHRKVVERLCGDCLGSDGRD
jgi:DNA-binding NtrC family response regulator